MEFSDDRSPYDVLGLAQGPASTPEDIKKAYRRLALIKHPDKAKTPNAAAEFDELQKAYAVLNNKDAKGALDDYIQARAAREQRHEKQSEKRRKLREQLDRREQAVAKERSEEEVARARLKVELQQLAQKLMEEQQWRREAEAAVVAARTAGASTSARSPGPAVAAGGVSSGGHGDQSEELRRTLKVSWDPTIGEYTSDALRRTFAAHGRVEDVILREPKKRKKASALVVMDSPAAAAAAASAACGDLHNPLLVVPYFRAVPGEALGLEGTEATAGTIAAAAGGSGLPDGSGAQTGGAGGQPLFANGAAAGAVGAASRGAAAPLFPGGVPLVQRLAPKASRPLFPAMAGAAAPQPASDRSNGSTPTGPPAPSLSTAPPSSFPTSFPPGPSGGFSSFPGFPAAAGAAVPAAAGLGSSALESSVLQKMRQRAEERRRALEEAQRQQELEDR